MTATETPPQTSPLPTTKTPPRKGMDGKTLLLFGPYKVGKSTLAAHLSESPLFLATEPGQDALDIYRQPINSWQDFLDVGKALVNGGDKWPFDRLVVDTVDELARLCAEHVLAGMAKSEGFAKDAFVHASDFEYGKGWDAVAQEFRLRVAKLCNLGLGVVFISHEKESTVKTRTGLEITKLAPDVGSKGMRKWLLGFVDFIVHAEMLQTTEGEQRVLRLKPSEQVEAGGRVPEGRDVPDLIPLSAKDLKATLEKALA
jgi:hypothetical protein